jgi:GntR family galactonate operon transcriptional repressor
LSDNVVRGAHGQIVHLMARRILTGQLAEGHTINVSSLQAELGVSLTAVREALKVLTAKGMVDARQKRGTFVRPRSDWHLLDRDVIRWQFDTPGGEGPDPQLLEELHEVRGIIEPAAARLAAERASQEDLDALDAALEAMATAPDPLAAVDADLAFHRTLLGATNNELLTKMEVFMETGLADRDRLVHLAKPSDDPVPSHRKVVEKIRARDPRGAERAMQRLLDKARRDLSEVRGG